MNDGAPNQTVDTIRTTVIEWLDDTYHFGEAESLIQSDDASLLDNGILDSLGYVNLTLFLEKRYALAIDRKSLTRDNFDSLNKITRYIQSHPQYRGG